MDPGYHFVTEIELDCPKSRVWETLGRVETWQTWWKWSRSIEVIRVGDEDTGVGAVYRNLVTTPIGYRLEYEAEVTSAIRERRIDLLSTGDIEGLGRFLLGSRGPATLLHFHWLVSTTKRWMNVAAPLARPVFDWSHDRLMTDFAHGIARASGASTPTVANRSLAQFDPAFGAVPDSPPT